MQPVRSGSVSFSGPLPIKCCAGTQAYLLALLVVDTFVKLVNTQQLDLFRKLCGNIKGKIHVDFDGVCLWPAAEFLYHAMHLFFLKFPSGYHEHNTDIGRCQRIILIPCGDKIRSTIISSKPIAAQWVQPFTWTACTQTLLFG